MSAAAATTPTLRAGPGLRAKVAAVVVLACLAALAAYAMFSGPTTVSVPTPRQAAPAQTTVPTHADEGPEGGGGD
jgi:hypothetical protein